MADALLTLTVSVQELGVYLDLTPRRIQQLVTEGVIPRAERGRYLLVAAIRAYASYWKSKAEAPERTAPGASTLMEAKTRQLMASAVKQEIEVEQLLASWIPVDIHQRVISQFGTQLVNQLKTVPARWRSRVEGLEGAALQGALDDLVQSELARLQETALAVDPYAPQDADRGASA